MSKEPEYQEALFVSPANPNETTKISMGVLTGYYSDPTEWAKYQNNLYCPECGNARLSYVNPKNTIAYLRTIQGQTHDNNCEHSIPAVNHKTFDSFCESRENGEFINGRLQAILRKYCLSENLTYSPTVMREANGKLTHDDVPVVKVSKQRGCKAIPRKNISTPLKDGDYNVYKIYYGKGDMIWEHQQEQNKHILHIFHNNKEFCSLHITENVYTYLVDDCKENRKDVYLAFCADLDPSRRKKTAPYDGSLRHSKYIVIIDP